MEDPRPPDSLQPRLLCNTAAVQPQLREEPGRGWGGKGVGDDNHAGSGRLRVEPGDRSPTWHYLSKASYEAGTVQGTGKRTNPAHQEFIIQRRRKTIQPAIPAPRAKKGLSRRTTTCIELSQASTLLSAHLLLKHVIGNIRKT